jgi:LysR family nitrogen assimilation transcriptional regulator
MRLADVVRRSLVMPSGPHALRQLLEEHTAPRGLPLNLWAEVESVQTVLSLVERGLVDTILPVSAVKAWLYEQPLHVATIHAPVMRNKLVLALPSARPATRLSRYATKLLRELVLKHFDEAA